MPRTLGTAAAEAAKKLGTEPIFLIEVDWGDAGFPTSPPLWYADKDYDGIPGKIVSLSGLDAIIKLGATGTTADLSVVLDDTDGSIKAIVDTNDFHKNTVRVYQSYAALAEADKFFLFAGQIETPIVYSEAERTIAFTVVTKLEDREVGFSVEEGQFEWISPAAIGKAWPLVFGSCIRVPALKLTEQVRGINQTNYGAISLGDLDNLCDRVRTMWDQDLAKQAADENPGFIDSNYAIVVNNLTSATIALNTLLHSLIGDSPNQETDLRAFMDACLSLYKNERNKELFGRLAAPIPERLAELNGSPGPPETAGEIEEKYVDILQEQAAYIAEPSDAGLAQIELLQSEHAALVAEEQELDGLLADYTLQLVVADVNIGIFTAAKKLLERQIAVIIVNPIIIENGEEFPQGVEVKIIIKGLIYLGSFSGRTFTVTESNLPADSNLQIGPRLNVNANEFWLVDPTSDLKGKYCKFPAGILYVDTQDQTRCFASPLLYEQTGALPALAGILINGEPVVREIWDPILLGSVIQETAVFIRPGWIDQLESNGLPDFADGRSNLTLQDYSMAVGDEVYLVEDYQDIYIANLIPSTEIKEVMGYRSIDGVRELVPVPSSYYSIDLSESIVGQTSTTIRMLRPLTQYVGEEWEEQIYVTLVSTVGPNTADIISYLATTYTDLTPDAASFASVATALTLYPSHFPVLSRPNVFALIETIAWQARCAAYTKADTLFIKYLSAEEASLATISESEIVFGTLELSMTLTDNLVTKFIAEWTKDHSEVEKNKVILRNNIPRYGKIEKTYDFFIYNIEGLVVKSATFWLLRYSNTWKMLKFTGFLDRLELETLDTVLLSLPDEFLASTDVKGTVYKAEYDSERQAVIYEIWTSVRAGEMEPYTFAWPSTASIGALYPTLRDPFAGGT